MRIQNTIVNQLIEDKDLIKIGDQYSLKVIHTPGHTKGHCCFYEQNSKIAFLADIDLSSLGPWYGGLDSNVMDLETDNIVSVSGPRNHEKNIYTPLEYVIGRKKEGYKDLIDIIKG